MQILYAGNGNPNSDDKRDEAFLLQSIDSMYDLYLLMLSLLIEVQTKAEDFLNKSQQKHLATSEEKNPNPKTRIISIIINFYGQYNNNNKK